MISRCFPSPSKSAEPFFGVWWRATALAVWFFGVRWRATALDVWFFGVGGAPPLWMFGFLECGGAPPLWMFGFFCSAVARYRFGFGCFPFLPMPPHPQIQASKAMARHRTPKAVGYFWERGV